MPEEQPPPKQPSVEEALSEIQKQIDKLIADRERIKAKGKL